MEFEKLKMAKAGLRLPRARTATGRSHCPRPEDLTLDALGQFPEGIYISTHAGKAASGYGDFTLANRADGAPMVGFAGRTFVVPWEHLISLAVRRGLVGATGEEDEG